MMQGVANIIEQFVLGRPGGVYDPPLQLHGKGEWLVGCSSPLS
jgi:hypothetical protein